MNSNANTGTAGVPPAEGRQTLRRWRRVVAKRLSRFALIAGETPAIPISQCPVSETSALFATYYELDDNSWMA
jgi:hypothetical protein